MHKSTPADRCTSPQQAGCFHLLRRAECLGGGAPVIQETDPSVGLQRKHVGTCRAEKLLVRFFLYNPRSHINFKRHPLNQVRTEIFVCQGLLKGTSLWLLSSVQCADAPKREPACPAASPKDGGRRIAGRESSQRRRRPAVLRSRCGLTKYALARRGRLYIL